MCNFPCGYEGSSHLSSVLAHQFLSLSMQVQHSYTSSTNQRMVEFHLLTFPRFPLRKPEIKKMPDLRIELPTPHYNITITGDVSIYLRGYHYTRYFFFFFFLSFHL